MKSLSIVFTIFALAVSPFIFAQQGPNQGPSSKQNEKIKAMKVEFITTKLELTPAEAEKFWPLYNEFQSKLHSLERNRRKTMRASEDKVLSDQEVDALIKLNFETDQDILDLKKEYDVKFKSVLSIQKVGKLYAAEEQFKRELLRQMKGSGPPK